MNPTTDKQRVLAPSTDASKADNINHGLIVQAALEQYLPDPDRMAHSWGSTF